MGSKRLPGKVLRTVGGLPMLQLQIERLKLSRLVDEIVVATTTSASDDPVEALCKKLGISCWRGAEFDVLSRVAELVHNHDAKIHVECFGDSPFVDPQLVDEFVGFILKNLHSFDFVSNTLSTTYPPGLEVVVYRGETLIETNLMVAADDPLREHVGYNITRFPDIFRLKSLEAPPHFHWPNFSLEVDTIEDFEVISRVVEHFKKTGASYFSLSEIIAFMNEHPEVALHNQHVHRRWKKLRN